jgi:hypothetical protein
MSAFSAKPDIIIDCETWLKPEIHHSEIMPPNYTIYRNDRKDGYGGVLIGVRSDIISTEYVNSKNIELVAVKVMSWSDRPGSGLHLLTNDGLLVINISRVLFFLVGKFTICSNKQSLNVSRKLLFSLSDQT